MTRWSLGTLFAVILLPLAVLLGFGKLTYAMVYAVMVSGVLITLVPRVALVAWILSFGFYLPYPTSLLTLYPYDVAAAALFTAVLWRAMVGNEPLWQRSPFDLVFVGLILATGLATLFAYDPSLSVIPLARILIIYAMYRTVRWLGLRLSITTLLVGFVVWVALLGLINASTFVLLGGGVRVFGTASVGFEMLAITAFSVATVYAIWDRIGWRRWLFTLSAVVMTGGVIATQARGPLLAMMIMAVIILFISAREARRQNRSDVRRHVAQWVTTILLAIGAGAVLGGAVLTDWWSRVERLIVSIGDPQGTIRLRLILWDAALQAWQAAPITGIGPGNFKIVEDIVPGVRGHYMWYFVHWMSPHNVALQLLAETGIVGLAAILAVAWRGLSISSSTARLLRMTALYPTALAILALHIAFATTLFFMRAWTFEVGAHLFALMFGLAAALWERQRRRVETVTH